MIQVREFDRVKCRVVTCFNTNRKKKRCKTFWIKRNNILKEKNRMEYHDVT